MESRQNGEITAYRGRLLEALRQRTHRQSDDGPGELEVLVNGDCVGILHCEGHSPSLTWSCRAAPIHAVEIRTASGLLVGHCCLMEAGRKVARIPVGRGIVDVEVHAREEGGTIRVSYQGAPSWSERLLIALAWMAEARSRMTGAAVSWPRVLAMTQLVIVAGLLVLLADRFHGSGLNPVSAPASMEALHSAESLARTEQRLAQLATGQQKTLAALQKQQEEIGRMQRTVEVVSRIQERVGAHVVNAEQEVRDLKARNDDTLRTRVVAELERAHAERRDLQEQLAGLYEQKNQLVAAMATLEARNHELTESLTRRESLLARIVPPVESTRPVDERAKPSLAGPAMTSPQTPDAQRTAPAQLLRFYVSFEEGTSEESIERLLRAIQGRRGPITSGWHRVEVTLPEAERPERFFESLRHEKIVKAVTAKLETTPAK